jgi:hypothetical protein
VRRRFCPQHEMVPADMRKGINNLVERVEVDVTKLTLAISDVVSSVPENQARNIRERDGGDGRGARYGREGDKSVCCSK